MTEPLVSVIIPWRTDHGPRERAWNWLCPRWVQLMPQVRLELVVEIDEDDGPFNRSRLVNRAVARSKGDILVMAGADHVPNPRALRWAAHHLAEGEAWVPMFDSVGYLNQADTDALIAGTATLDEVGDEQVYHHATGPLALWRSTFDRVGGMDERFEGWGFEDAAFRSVLATLFGKIGAQHRLRCLWHSTTHRGDTSPNRTLMETDYLPLQGRPIATALFVAALTDNPNGVSMHASANAQAQDWLLTRLTAELPGTVLEVGANGVDELLKAHAPESKAKLLQARPRGRRLPTADVVVLSGLSPRETRQSWYSARQAARKTLLAVVELDRGFGNDAVHALGGVVASANWRTGTLEDGRRVGCYAVAPALT